MDLASEFFLPGRVTVAVTSWGKGVLVQFMRGRTAIPRQLISPYRRMAPRGVSLNGKAKLRGTQRSNLLKLFLGDDHLIQGYGTRSVSVPAEDSGCG